MREIKFRVWDGCNIMTEPMTLADIVYQENNGMMDTQEPTFIWMQFTGLKDKNGNKIWEGDVLPGGWIVVWNKMSARFELADSIDKPAAREEFVLAENDKVIGNIYENPELLDGHN